MSWKAKGESEEAAVPHFQAGQRWVSSPDERWVKSLFELFEIRLIPVTSFSSGDRKLYKREL